MSLKTTSLWQLVFLAAVIGACRADHAPTRKVKDGRQMTEELVERMAARREKLGPDDLFIYGTLLYLRRDYKQASEVFRSILADSPDDKAARLMLVRCMLALDQRAGASELVGSLAKGKSDDPQVKFLRAEVNSEGVAVAMLEALVRDHPDFAPAYLRLAQARRGGGNDEAAKAYLAEYFRRSIDPSPWHRSHLEQAEWLLLCMMERPMTGGRPTGSGATDSASGGDKD